MTQAGSEEHIIIAVKIRLAICHQTKRVNWNGNLPHFSGILKAGDGFTELMRLFRW